jgi:hypothetical protein
LQIVQPAELYTAEYVPSAQSEQPADESRKVPGLHVAALAACATALTAAWARSAALFWNHFCFLFWTTAASPAGRVYSRATTQRGRTMRL